MVKLKLRRTGKKKQPYYRLIAADSRCAPSGKFIEMLGNYDPHTDPPTVNFKADRVKEWLSKGAQPTESVKKLLVISGIWERPEYPEAPVKEEPEKTEEPEAEAKAEVKVEPEAEAKSEAEPEAKVEPEPETTQGGE